MQLKTIYDCLSIPVLQVGGGVILPLLLLQGKVAEAEMDKTRKKREKKRRRREGIVDRKTVAAQFRVSCPSLQQAKWVYL